MGKRFIMGKNNISIAIIDDGVYENFFDIPPLEYKIAINRNLEVVQEEDCKEPVPDNGLPNHGTICAAIIHKFAPDASLGSIKVLNRDKKGMKEQLVKAIEWCIENGIKVINMSLGTVHYSDSIELKRVVDLAAERGIVIVSACSNQYIITYPSSFTNVVGVKADFTDTLKEGEYTYNFYPNDGVDITAYGAVSLRRINEEAFYSESCNSYATPFITAKVYNIIKKNPYAKVDDVKRELMKGAINKKDKESGTFMFKSIDWAKRALMINFNNNKYYSGNSRIEIIEKVDLVCDCYCSGEEEIENLLSGKGYKHENFDTVIIDGNEIPYKHDVCNSDRLIQKAMDYGKNVIYLDDRDANRDINVPRSNATNKVWHPSIFKYLDVPILREIDIPMIVVSDFTERYLYGIMEDLRSSFLKDGYNITTASDSCLGILYGNNYNPLWGESVIKEYDPAGLKTLYGLYNPDVLLYGMNASGKKSDYFYKLIKSFEVDIFIIVLEELNNTVKEFIDECKKKDSQLILVMPETENDEAFADRQNMKFFSLSHGLNADEIYAYMLDLYKVSGDSQAFTE
ncbi:MAG TPA: S8 family serine peptidase [Acetivibrio sp.]|uniref:S8 family serine peptidase n=1 Tax=Acetivibrio sp. TaxID=1872092 RepID=UPI002CA6E1CC|nr:S8 family serine peptidase [Acetivibrio sp.]HOM03448.1 S8 family serine peptidase [Acetivibrio sp.]